MIETGLAYVVSLVLIVSVIKVTEKKSGWRFFEYLPGIVILYFSAMLLASFGLWQKNESIQITSNLLKSNLLPAMIFLMLLGADIRQIMKLGKRMLLSFFLASLSIGIGFIGMFSMFHTYFETDAWKAFAALSGSWMGGTGNMVAIQGALGVPDSKMGYALLIDSIDYALWVMILLALVPFAKYFNRWSKADTSIIDEVSRKLSVNISNKKKSLLTLLILLSISLFISWICQYGASFLPTTAFLSPSTWVVIIATILGILFAMTLLARLAGAVDIGSYLLYGLVALIASGADIAEFSQAPFYIFSGFIVILIHALLMILFAKLFRLDLFSIGVASLANIGGVASAPILASAYSGTLIPIGVLMAMMGYIVGTFGGLMVGKILQVIVL